MATETCGFCGSVTPYDDAVHLTVHTNSEDGVLDDYVCRSCYEERLEAIFEESPVE